jgi:hypothetical protein
MQKQTLNSTDAQPSRPSTTVLYNCCWCSNRRVGLPKRTNTAIIAKYKSISILGSSVKTTAVVNTTVPGWHRCCTARPKYASAPLSRTLRLGSCAEQVPEVQQSTARPGKAWHARALLQLGPRVGLLSRCRTYVVQQSFMQTGTAGAQPCHSTPNGHSL